MSESLSVVTMQPELTDVEEKLLVPLSVIFVMAINSRSTFYSLKSRLYTMSILLQCPYCYLVGWFLPQVSCSQSGGRIEMKH